MRDVRLTCSHKCCHDGQRAGGKDTCGRARKGGGVVSSTSQVQGQLMERVGAGVLLCSKHDVACIHVVGHACRCPHRRAHSLHKNMRSCDRYIKSSCAQVPLFLGAFTCRSRSIPYDRRLVSEVHAVGHILDMSQRTCMGVRRRYSAHIGTVACLRT
jgi:hypothetical protein